MVPEVLNVEDITRGLALIFPGGAIGVENSLSKELHHLFMENWAFFEIIKVGLEDILHIAWICCH